MAEGHTLTREDVARIEVGHTTVSRPVAGFLVVLFLVVIGTVPLIEIASLRKDDGETSSWSHLAAIPRRAAALAKPLGEGSGVASLWARLVRGNRGVLEGFSGFERSLEEESVLGRAMRPSAQYVMTRWLGAGNERVYPGRLGWLFYRPDVEHVTGRGFLDARQIQRRVTAASEWEVEPHPDPRPALTAFARSLQARGIVLMVVPTPVKPTIHPEHLRRRQVITANTGAPPQNASFVALVRDLRAAGVLVFDPAPALAAMASGGPQYLATDTHWRPEAMELIAEQLAPFIARHASLPPAGDPGYEIERTPVIGIGDTARMLDLADPSSLFPAETVWLRRILRPDGTLWRTERDSDVLVLGDSFSNIYSLESMGWGTSAGFVEQLSHTLRRPLDRLLQNDEAAFATRAMLCQDPGRLAGKRVVVYQFTTRELSFGNWTPLEDGVCQPSTSPQPAPPRRPS